jgi:hypothetical protein
MKGARTMNKKEIEIAERSFDIIEKAKEDLLELCNGESVSLTLSVLITSADSLLETAKEIRERASKRKDVWDLIRDALEETLK